MRGWVTIHVVPWNDEDFLSEAAKKFERDREMHDYFLNENWTLFIVGIDDRDALVLWTNTMYDWRLLHTSKIHVYFRPRIEEVSPGKFRFKFRFFEQCLEMMWIPPWRCDCGCNRMWPVIWSKDRCHLKEIVQKEMLVEIMDSEDDHEE